MSLIMCSENGMPGIVDSKDLHSIDGNPCAERLIEIAAAFERVGIEGVRVQYAPVDGDRFVLSLNIFAGSFGERLIEFFAEYARKHKKIFSVEVALQIAAAIQNREAKNE